jgi:hypothetical protein
VRVSREGKARPRDLVALPRWQLVLKCWGLKIGFTRLQLFAKTVSNYTAASLVDIPISC